MPEDFLIARASVHRWEEPPISGSRGSGTVFFSGCNLGCVYCQNYDISHRGHGKAVSGERFREIFRELTAQGVHNINLVNPTHYALYIADALKGYEKDIPLVYNTSGYEKADTLRELQGLVDIYLPDMKYALPEKSLRYSGAEDYFLYASEALTEMKRQQEKNILDSEGIMQKGIIVRHLILPKNTKNSLAVLQWISNNLGNDTTISLMSQYTPSGNLTAHQELSRKITVREYDKVLDYALSLGFKNIFTQEPDSAAEGYIPDFDFTGV